MIFIILRLFGGGSVPFFIGLAASSVLKWFYFFWAGLIIFLVCTRLGVYNVIIAGWSSNYGYSLLGGLRAVAETISYEVRLALILLCFVVLISRYNFTYFYFFQVYLWLIILSFPLSFIWSISCLVSLERIT